MEVEDDPKIMEDMFTEKDVKEAVSMTNFQKALGEDWFDGSLLLNKDVGKHLQEQIRNMLNFCHIPEYLKISRLNLLSKTDKTQVGVDEVRPIAILSHVLKVIEKAIKNKAEDLGD